MRIDKISSYMNYGRSYNSYIREKKYNNNVKDNYEEAIPLVIFDESYNYVAYLNNMLYLKKNGMLYKVDMSTCSSVRVATLIEYLKSNE